MSSQDDDMSLPVIGHKLSSLNDNDLDVLWHSVDAEVKRRENRRRQNAKKKIIDLAAQFDIDLGTLAENRPTIRFCDPKNPFNTWSGRGRKPKWVIDALATGLTLDQLRVAEE